MRRIKFVMMAVVIIAIAFGTALLTRHRLVWKPSPDDVKSAKKAIALYRSAPTARADDHAALVSAFSSGVVSYNDNYDKNGNTIPSETAESESLSDTQRSSLLETMAQIIELRFRANADAYAQWMRSRGYTLKDVDKSNQHYGYVFQYRIGRNFSPEDTPWDIFKLTFEAELGGGKDSATHPTGVVSSPDAMEIWVGTQRNPDPGAAYDWYMHTFYAKGKEASQTNPPDLSKIRWTLGQAYAGWAHWSPPINYGDIIKRDGKVLFAQVNYVLRTRKHGSVPITSVLYYEPNADMWRLYKMSYVDTFEMPLGLGPEF